MTSRESALNLILNIIKSEDLVVCCNGKLGRELFELRIQREEQNNDFILLGAMGCALGVALGVARNTDKKVFCLLGDGNFLMKMGSLATVLELAPRNLYVYILNNNCHDSTGGQPTAFNKIYSMIPRTHTFRVFDIDPGSREDLGRPTISASEITERFMAHTKQTYEIPS